MVSSVEMDSGFNIREHALTGKTASTLLFANWFVQFEGGFVWKCLSQHENGLEVGFYALRLRLVPHPSESNLRFGAPEKYILQALISKQKDNFV